MSTDYRTIRVTPKTYDRLVEVQRRLSARAHAELPTSARGVTDATLRNNAVPLGVVIASALEALDSEMDQTDAPAPGTFLSRARSLVPVHAPSQELTDEGLANAFSPENIGAQSLTPVQDQSIAEPAGYTDAERDKMLREMEAKARATPDKVKPSKVKR